LTPCRSSSPEESKLQNAFPAARQQKKLDKYTPYLWQDFFDESMDISIPNTSDISFFFFNYVTNNFLIFP
jgi:hypothetical protein